jgi:hypothetical protein
MMMPEINVNARKGHLSSNNVFGGCEDKNGGCEGKPK